MAELRKCGHPLGSTRWCPECELAAQPQPEPTSKGDEYRVVWTDELGATHSVSIPYAAELLKQMFDEWPDGVNEIDSAMSWRDREIARLNAEIASLSSQQRKTQEAGKVDDNGRCLHGVPTRLRCESCEQEAGKVEAVADEPLRWNISSGGYRFFRADGSEVHPSETPLYLRPSQQALGELVNKIKRTALDTPIEEVASGLRAIVCDCIRIEAILAAAGGSEK